MQGYDIIGDIHGQYDKLTALLAELGYQRRQATFTHPTGRQVIFLGDFIDRGPEVRAVLVTVRAMVENGDALAILGNHEYNAVCYHTPDDRGGWLRPRAMERNSGITATLEQFRDAPEEWADWLQWMRSLPMFLDLGELRAVHACWDGPRIAKLPPRPLEDDAFLRASVVRGTPEHRAVTNLLKGPEMRMPEGTVFHDKEGIARRRVRVRWWDLPAACRVGDVAMPLPFDAEGDADPGHLRRVPNYGPDEPPVFFGHYWLPADHVREPLRHNICCLDFSAARGGPLVAYRWQGEAHLTPENFVIADSSADSARVQLFEGLQPCHEIREPLRTD